MSVVLGPSVSAIAALSESPAMLSLRDQVSAALQTLTGPIESALTQVAGTTAVMDQMQSLRDQVLAASAWDQSLRDQVSAALQTITGPIESALAHVAGTTAVMDQMQSLSDQVLAASAAIDTETLLNLQRLVDGLQTSEASEAAVVPESDVARAREQALLVQIVLLRILVLAAIVVARKRVDDGLAELVGSVYRELAFTVGLVLQVSNQSPPVKGALTLGGIWELLGIGGKAVRKLGDSINEHVDRDEPAEE